MEAAKKKTDKLQQEAFAAICLFHTFIIPDFNNSNE